MPGIPYIKKVCCQVVVVRSWAVRAGARAPPIAMLEARSPEAKAFPRSENQAPIAFADAGNIPACAIPMSPQKIKSCS